MASPHLFLPLVLAADGNSSRQSAFITHEKPWLVSNLGAVIVVVVVVALSETRKTKNDQRRRKQEGGRTGRGRETSSKSAARRDPSVYT